MLGRFSVKLDERLRIDDRRPVESRSDIVNVLSVFPLDSRLNKDYKKNRFDDFLYSSVLSPTRAGRRLVSAGFVDTFEDFSSSVSFALALDGLGKLNECFRLFND